MLRLFRARVVAGGLDVSDSALRFARFEGKKWKLVVQKLPPGVLERGIIKNYAELVSSLAALKKEITGKPASRGMIHVAVCMSSVSVYTQMFALPVIAGDKLEKAAVLNMQIAAPSSIEENYVGWQVIGENKEKGRLELLGAFMDKSLSDGIGRALAETGFFPMASEFRMLALTRFLRIGSAGFDADVAAYLVVELTPAGIDFAIIRHGQLFFEYFNAWNDVQEGKRQITVPEFEAVIVQNFHRMFNFYNQHWNEKISGVFLIAGGLVEETTRIIKDNFELGVIPIMMKGGEMLEPDWFAPIGSGMRALIPRSEDKEINLLGVEAKRNIGRAHIRHFFHFWRVTVPAGLMLLLIAYGAVYAFVDQISQGLQNELAAQSLEQQERATAEFRERLERFNRAVAVARSARSEITPRGELLSILSSLAHESGVTIDRLFLTSSDQRVLFNGTTKTSEGITLFKQAVAAFRKNADGSENYFRSVDLPLTDVRSVPGGVSFSMTFSVDFSKTD